MVEGVRTIVAPLGRPGPVALLVGPEGGASPAEEERIAAHGFLRVGLGPWILRVETAALLAVALTHYEWSRLGAP